MRQLAIIFLFLSISIGCSDTSIVAKDKIQLIIDADTANEVDDLFAIVRAILEPKFDLLGITSAQFHISPLASDTTALESQKLNEEILELMTISDIALPLGSNTPMSASGKPEISAASNFIIAQAHKVKKGQKLNIAILGPCTNVASAILQDSTIIPKISIHYIGFWHDAENNTYDKKEFNSRNDSIAVDLLLNTLDLDFNVMTATTCQHLVFEKTTVDEKLKGKKGIAHYLVNRWESYDRWFDKVDLKKEKWIMWDVAIIEALANPHLAVKETFTTPPENTRRYIEAYTSIEVEAMKEEFWKALSEIPHRSKY